MSSSHLNLKNVCFNKLFGLSLSVKSCLTYISTDFIATAFAKFRVTNWLLANQTCMYNGLVSTSCDHDPDPEKRAVC